VILRFVAAGVILKLNYENKQFGSDQLFTDTVQEVVSERFSNNNNNNTGSDIDLQLLQYEGVWEMIGKESSRTLNNK
jgi:hypothetical protein